MSDARDISGEDARRTLLASERTYLAWWRTGITTLTVALAAARVVPELSDVGVRWPYTVFGVAFAVLGTICIGYAEYRRRAVDRAVREGDFTESGGVLTLLLSVMGVLLGVGLVVLIAATD
jgi:putative membrane protein